MISDSSLAASKRRILLVEDSEIIRETLQALLESSGFVVEAVSEGLVAVAQFTQAPYELVLIDVGLPDISGYEVAQRLRGAPSGAAAYLVAMTGHAQPSDKAKALEAGFDVHLAKPFEIEDLEALLNSRLAAMRES